MTPAFDQMAFRACYSGVTWLSTRPVPYYGLRKLLGKHDHLCVAPKTELVIEGYPRSANTTMVYGFLDRQPRPVQVAHHKHHAAQLLRAVDWGIPAVMLIRRPKDAALSYLAMRQEARMRGEGLRHPSLRYESVILRWVTFYKAMLPHLDKVVIAPFDEVIQDLAGVIEGVNLKFGTDFRAGPPLNMRVKPLGWHALPTHERNEIKRDLDTEFYETYQRSPRLRHLTEQANDLHQLILSA